MARVIIRPETVTSGQREEALFWLVAGFGEEQRAIGAPSEVGSMLVVSLNRIAIIHAQFYVRFFWELDLGHCAPVCRRISREAVWHIEEGRGGLPADAVRHEMA